MSKTNILIYNDEGTGARSLHQLVKSFKEHRTKHSLVLVDRHHLANHNWHSSTRCLVMPGGRDIPYHEALKGKANQKIKEYVSNGGKYLGICAGAYYACGRIVFEKGSPLEIIAQRELGFYPGSAVGPAYGNGYYYQDERAARIARLRLPSSDTASFFNGGCYFADSQAHPSIQVLAHYQDIENQPAAIVECPVGLGIAVLCGVHPEYSARFIKASQDPYLQKLLPELADIEKERKDLFTHLLDRLSI